MARVTVVGAGVVGLSCAVRLAEAGHRVDVLARDLPLETTSAVAGGLWMPFLAEPRDAVTRWARETFTAFARLAGQAAIDSGMDGAEAGVRMRPGLLLDPPGGTMPSWTADLSDLAPVVAEPRPPATPLGASTGWRVTVPLVDMSRYLPFLRDRLAAAGGTLTRLPMSALPGRGIVVNCSGLAARALAADPSLRPVRGQVVLLADPGLDQWWVDERHADGIMCYVLPHGRHVVVGGTTEDGDWSTTPRARTADRILQRAVDLVPALGGAAVLGHRVGLRPLRPSVRLETERSTGDDGAPRTVIHCYGHGGCGVTLSWGCAGEVVEAVEAVDAPTQ
jgi:D-amino-acid oxidase